MNKELHLRMSSKLPVSIFNDVIGPVMRGPSSSHCAAALRIGRLARDLMGDQFDEVLVEFDRNGSLPTTHDSQGSDMGLFGGLMGWDDGHLTGAVIHSKSGLTCRVVCGDKIWEVNTKAGKSFRLTLVQKVDPRSVR